jgi:hypothetical protein
MKFCSLAAEDWALGGSVFSQTRRIAFNLVTAESFAWVNNRNILGATNACF